MRLTLIILGWLVFFGSFAADEKECKEAGNCKPADAADVYKCIDDKGFIDYQAKPCAEGQKNVAINLRTGKTRNMDELAKEQESTQKEQLSAEEQKKQAEQQLLDEQLRIKKEATAESDKNQNLIKNNPEQFSPYALPPFNAELLSELVKKFPTRLADIERLKRISAEKALATNECNRVEASDLESKSTKIMLALAVNCSSGKTFHYLENDLK